MGVALEMLETQLPDYMPVQENKPTVEESSM